jgi:hypothetical protein
MVWARTGAHSFAAAGRPTTECVPEEQTHAHTCSHVGRHAGRHTRHACVVKTGVPPWRCVSRAVRICAALAHGHVGGAAVRGLGQATKATKATGASARRCHAHPPRARAVSHTQPLRRFNGRAARFVRGVEPPARSVITPTADGAPSRRAPTPARTRTGTRGRGQRVCPAADDAQPPRGVARGRRG